MSEQQQPRTLLVVDDHELVRVGLRQVIVQRFADRFPVEEAHSLAQALSFLERRADEVFLLLLDLNLGDARGLSGLKLLGRLYPRLRVAIVSGTHDARVREEALAHGALGYFCKTGDTRDLSGLLDTIERAAAPGAAGPGAARGAGLPSVPLNNRQIQVLELLLSGLDNRAIAAETGLALGSVKNCVSAIFLSFNVRSRAELIGRFS